MQVSDKELLAICNLSNLKMEFANLKRDTDTTVIDDEGNETEEQEARNHTISSLLEAEKEAILNNDDSKRVFILEK